MADQAPCVLEAVCSRTTCGDELHLCGSHEALGAWDVAKALKLHTDPESFPRWTLTLPACVGEFKLFIKRCSEKALA